MGGTAATEGSIAEARCHKPESLDERQGLELEVLDLTGSREGEDSGVIREIGLGMIGKVVVSMEEDGLGTTEASPSSLIMVVDTSLASPRENSVSAEDRRDVGPPSRVVRESSESILMMGTIVLSLSLQGPSFISSNSFSSSGRTPVVDFVVPPLLDPSSMVDLKGPC